MLIYIVLQSEEIPRFAMFLVTRESAFKHLVFYLRRFFSRKFSCNFVRF